MQDNFLLEFEVFCSPENAWRLFADPLIVKQYMFGSVLESDLQAGSEINFFQQDGENDDKLVVTGKVLEVEHGKRLKHTLFPADATYENKLENHLAIEYTISENQGKTILKIDQSGFAKVEDGKNRFNHTASGWMMLKPKVQDLSRNLGY